VTGSGSPPSRPPSEEPTLAGDVAPASGPSRPPSEEDTLLAGESIPVVRDEPVELDGGEPESIGRYEVLRRIGEGGMGLIFEARDPELDRKVAIKLVRPALHERSDDARARLLREAQTLAKITHPNVIHVYEVGTFGEQVYVAMEFVDGLTLRDWQWKEHVSWRAILDAYVAAGRGLAAAHARGMVHRDFKPDNVLITADAKVRVIDFGLARGGGVGPDPDDLADTARDVDLVAAETVDIAQPMTRLTKTGAILGTPAYMAPEQHHGCPADGRTDQFSFCVALYEALYGMRPFAGKTYPALVRNVLDGRVEEEPRFVEVPPWIRRALLRGLSVEPGDRFATMDALIDELRADPRTRTRRRGLVAGVLALGVVGTGVWSSVERARDVRHERDALRRELGQRRLDERREAQRDAASRPASEAWNEYVIAHARTRIEHDASLALASLRALSDPDLETLTAARLLAEQALERGVATSFSDASAGIDAIAISPDGTHLATVTDETVELWNGHARTDSLVGPSRVTACAVAAGGQPVVVGHEDGSVLLLGEEQLVLDLHEHEVTAVAIAPSRDRFATADGSGEVVVWRLVDGRPEVWRRAQRHSKAVRALDFGADSDALASGGDDGRVVRWNAEEKTHRDLESGAVSVPELVWEGDAIVILGSDGTVSRWFPEAGKSETIGNGVRHLAATASGLFGIDDDGDAIVAPPDLDAARLGPALVQVLGRGPEHLISLDEEGRIQTWTVRAPAPTPIGEPLSGTSFVRFSERASVVAAATGDGTVAAWDRGSRERVLRLDSLGETLALSVAPDGEHLVLRTRGGVVYGSAIEPGAAPWSTASCGYDLGEPIAWSPDASTVAMFECAPTGVGIRRADGEVVAHVELELELGTHRRSLRFSADAGRLYVDPGPAFAPQIVDPTDAVSSPLEWSGQEPSTRLAQAWTGDGLVRVLGLDPSGDLGIWQQHRASGPLLRTDAQPVEDARVDDAGAFVLTNHADGTSLLWDVAAQTQRLVPAPPDDLEHFVVSADGRWLLAQPGARSRPRSTLVHVPSGTRRRIDGLFSPAALDDHGHLADTDGGQVRTWASTVPETWPVFHEWVGEITDPMPPIDMSVGPGFDPPDG
jgi:tRNA A-37 threonylcarbamoyl transferase component Bud32